MLQLAVHLGQLAADADGGEVTGRSGVVVDVLQVFGDAGGGLRRVELVILGELALVELRHDDLQAMKMPCAPPGNAAGLSQLQLATRAVRQTRHVQ
ncbi:hypothetical protein Hsero_2506 [Herbaspirillum seropedicae SmR1]|uniref:Uncharacterized protein n=1 Tax=Herbaspirillum seropedicae (strain SmR1) TaxID=757424 RepID=D8IWI5_HERSS|nr:hypothetical protein Hsero_2506 [Herbaspirillum seropedicae SmR1]